MKPTTHSLQPTTVDLNALFACLALRERRLILRILYEQASSSITKTKLTAALGQEDTDQSTKENTDQSTIQLRLHHTHLPKLEDAGLIQSDGDELAATDHQAFEDTGLVDVIRGDTDEEPASIDTLFESLAHPRRRTVLDVLSHQLHPIHVETLAREVGASEQDTTEQQVSGDDVETILVSLHHNHLPRLADADLIEYDADEERVKYSGHPELRVPWMHSVLEPTFGESLTDTSESHELDTIEGLEQVVSYGQSQIQRAEQEVFCMLTHPDMLQAGCFTRVENAVERGVIVYLGTRDPSVREYVQESLPEVVLWEPSQNWLNLPVGGSSVGRLLMVDRETVMLGTVKDPLDGEIPEERAIVGEGADNALVVMIRQLLRPHLEAMDEQAEESEVNLPL